MPSAAAGAISAAPTLLACRCKLRFALNLPASLPPCRLGTVRLLQAGPDAEAV